MFRVMCVVVGVSLVAGFTARRVGILILCELSAQLFHQLFLRLMNI